MLTDRPNIHGFKCGRLRPRFQNQFRLRTYRQTPKRPVPLVVTNSQLLADWGVLGNDVAGDCVLASMLHALRLWLAATGNAAACTWTDAQILELYLQLTGGVDNGLDPNTVLAFFRQTGLFGHRIEAYADVHGFDDLMLAISDLGCVSLGGGLPDAVLPENGDWTQQKWIWTPGMTVNPDNGHEFLAVDYDAGAGLIGVLSWGKLITMDVAFMQNVCDQKSAMVSRDYLTTTGVTPGGLDINAMLADIPLVST